MIPASDLKRLLASMAVSCLLHAALVSMPYFDFGTSASRPAAQGGQKLKPPRAIDATLVLENRSAIAVAEVSTKGGGMADSSAGRVAGEPTRRAPNRTEGIGLLPIPAPTYYTTDKLTKRPRPTAEPELDAPEIGPIFASGTVILKLWISELGDVSSVEVEKTDLPEIFSRTAVAAFRRLRFVPGEINGQRVGTMMRIEITYDDRGKPPH